jgi:hypothetical protein
MLNLLQAHCHPYCIGRVQAEPGVFLSQQGRLNEISMQGFDHFGSLTPRKIKTPRTVIASLKTPFKRGGGQLRKQLL